MRIAGYKIDLSEIDKRIFIVIGLLLIGLVYFIFFRPQPEEIDPLTLPAAGFEIEEVEKLNFKDQRWIDAYAESLGGIIYPQNVNNIYDGGGVQQPEGVKGEMFNFRVYIPGDPAGDFPNFTSINTNGFDFTAGYFVSPSATLPVDGEISALAGDGESNFVQLAFPEGTVPGQDTVLQVEGVLWWDSAEILNLAGINALPDPDDGRVAPTILVTNYQRLPKDEVAAPANYIAPINQAFEQNPYRVSIEKIEWVSGKSIRACLSVENISNAPVDLWAGTEDATANYSSTYGSLSSEASIDDASAFSNNQSLDPGQIIYDYIVFGDTSRPPVGSPEQQLAETKSGLTIRFPGLSSEFNISETESIELVVNASRFQKVQGGQEAASKTERIDTLPGCSSV